MKMLNADYIKFAADRIAKELNEGADPADAIWGSCSISNYSDMASFIKFFLEHFQTTDVDYMVGDLLQELFIMYASDAREEC